jgi:NADPH2:quinone reductase
MKAIRVQAFGDEKVLLYEDYVMPPLGPNDVLIDVKAVGVNPVETYIRSGVYPRKPNLPYTPGSDAAGVVIQVGSKVSKVAIGDRVYTTASLTGSYAEQMISLADDVHLLSSNLSFEQGAAIGIPYYTAYQALMHKAQPNAKDIILVHGASGGVGLACLQIAKSKGFKVIATAGSKEGRELLEKEGADLVLDHHDDSRFEKMIKWTEGKGVQIILEMLSNANLAKDLEILDLYGRVVVVGCRDSVEINPRLMMGKDTSILGMTIFNATVKEKEMMIQDLSEGFEEGKLTPRIGKKLKLSEAAKAHLDILTDKALGKMVLEV